MEIAVQQLVYEPPGDTGTAHCHHFSRLSVSVAVNKRAEPRWDSKPILANVEREVINGAIKAIEAAHIFTVVKRGTGLGEALVRKRILELLQLRFFLKVILFHLAVFVLWYNNFRIGVYSIMKQKGDPNTKRRFCLRSSSCLISNWAGSSPAKSSLDLLGGGVLRPCI